LRGCPQLRILATSREALGIPGEVNWRVSSLLLPPTEVLPPLSDLLQIEAVRLFVDRARAVQPDFALTDQNAAAVAEICRRLDGIPLALELAAARLIGLSPAQIAARLDQRFRLLTGGSRTALPRHQTLTATVAWSYDLLNASEQTVFNRLAVFLDGFTLDAAEVVGSASPLSPADVLDLLLRLVDKSLVVAEPGDERQQRYRLLETLRQYARDKLVAGGEADVVARGHARYFLALAEEAEPALHGAEQATWFDRLAREHNNLRAAMEYLAATERWEDALRVAGALSWFWAVRGHYTEGRSRLSALVERCGPGASALLRAKAYAGLAFLAYRQGDMAQAQVAGQVGRAAAEEAGDKKWIVQASLALFLACRYEKAWATELDHILSVARDIGLDWAAGRCLWLLTLLRFEPGNRADYDAALSDGMAVSRQAGDMWGLMRWTQSECYTAYFRGEYARTQVTAEEMSRLARRLGDRSGQASALVLGGFAALAEGDLPIARLRLTEGHRIYRDIADRAGIMMAANPLVETYLLAGEIAPARDIAAEGIRLARDSGDRALLGDALWAGAEVALAQGDLATARSQFGECFALYGDLADRFVPHLLENLARVAGADRAPARALRLAGASATLRAKLGPKVMQLRPIDEARLAPTIQEATTMLGEHDFAAAWAEGQTLTLEQAIEYALGDDSPER
jgi:non-specific serine/threonine protein kinase